jgi:hypothetical protein
MDSMSVGWITKLRKSNRGENWKRKNYKTKTDYYREIFNQNY